MRSFVTIFFILCFYLQALDVDGYGTWNEFTNYFSALKKAGLNITSSSLKHDLKIFGDYTYTSVIINTNSFDEEKLLDFVNNGNSVVVVLNEDSKELIDFVEELGLTVGDAAKDGVCTYTSPTEQTVIPNLKCGGFPLGVSRNNASAVYYPLLKKANSNQSFAYAVQGVNDARIVVFGSDAFLSDEADAEASKNSLKAAVDVTLWAFRLKGLLRYSNLTYLRHADGLINVPELAINDNITFNITLESFDTDENGKGSWKPFSAKDVQLQYSMLVPRIRKTLVPLKNGVHSLTFRLPDIFGIYQFIVDFQPYGYTHINATHTVRMRPYRHNEFPRYLTSAYPYYSVALVMLVGVVVVSVVFVLHAPIFDEGVDGAKLTSSSSTSSLSSSTSSSTSGSSPSAAKTSRKSSVSASPDAKVVKKKAEGAKTTTKKKE